MLMKERFTNIGAYRQSTQATRARQLPLTMFALLLLAPFCAAQSGAANPKKPSLSSADKNKTIYVTDFELDPNNFKQDKGGVTGKGYLLPPPPGSFSRRKHQDPETAANNLIRLMSESLVADLQKDGLRLAVYRLAKLDLPEA